MRFLDIAERRLHLLDRPHATVMAITESGRRLDPLPALRGDRPRLLGEGVVHGPVEQPGVLQPSLMAVVEQVPAAPRRQPLKF